MRRFCRIFGRFCRILALGPALVTLGWSPIVAGAQSQASTGVIRGSVLDPADTPVAGAVVRMTHHETGLVTTVLTTRSGTFVRPLLPLGTYDVAAQAEDQLGSATAQGLVLRVGEELNLALRFTAVELEGITVQGDRELLVHPEDVTSSTRLSEEVVDGIPNNGRNYLDFALLTPGVAISQGPDGDELNISGQRGIFNNFIVDGADFNNPFFGEQRGGQRPAFTFSQDAIEEVVVVNQGASAEFGRSAGGFVNVITKSGTNELTGSAHYFGQWDGISAAYPVASQAGEPDFMRNQFGFTLGGPIARDRAFFFVAYDQQEATETKQMHRVVENPANLAKLKDFLTSRWPGLFEDEFGPIPRTDDARALLTKADFHLDSRNQVSFKYNYNWSEQLNGTFDVDSWGQAGVEYNRTAVSQQFIGFANGRYVFDSVDGFINFVTHGSRYVTCSDGSDSATGTCPDGAAITGPVLLYLQSGTVPGVAPDRLGRGDFGVNELAFYLQDTWKPTDGLTLNLGVRWEGTWHPQVAVQPNATFFAPYLGDPRFPSDGTIPDDLDNFQPRLGLAWDVSGDARTVVRLNAGAYHSRIPMLVFAQSVTTNGAFQQILFRNSFGLPEQAPPAVGELIDGSATAPFLPDIHVTAKDLDLPRTRSFAAAVERQLARQAAFNVSYPPAPRDKRVRRIQPGAGIRLVRP